MATQALTERTFAPVVNGNRIVLVDFWASWCGWCTRFAPIYVESSNIHPEVVHGTVDTEAEQGLAGAAQVSGLPTLLGFREGLLVYNQPGFQTAAQLEEVVQQILWMDMDEVRRETERQQQPTDTRVTPMAAAVAGRGAGPASGPVRYGWPGLRYY